MLETKVKIDLKTITLSKSELIWNVILFNCDCHTFDDVIDRLMDALGFSEQKASQVAYVADQFGSVCVYEGSREDCDKVANTIGITGLKVVVDQK